MEPNSPEAWFKSLPVVTRTLLVTFFTSTCLVSLGFLDPHVLIFDWPLVYKRYHIWRILSSVIFLGGFSFGFVMQLYLFTNFGSKLEISSRFSKSSGDYVYFMFLLCVFVALLSLIVAWPRGYALTGSSVIFAMIYYWSRIEPEAPLSLWGFHIKGYQLPFALIFLTLLMGGDIWKDVVGLAAGHSYYFLKDIVPLEYGRDIVNTPRFFVQLVDKLSSKSSVQNAPAAAAPVNPAANRWFGGAGQRLGGN